MNLLSSSSSSSSSSILVGSPLVVVGFFFLQLNCRLYVVDEEKKVQGVVSLTDILRAVLATAEIKEGKEGKQ